MIIDIHTHNFPRAIATRAINGMCAQTEGLLYAVGDGTLANHLDHMEYAGVDMAVACPIATKPNMFEGIYRRAIAIKEGEFGERIKRHIIPFASIHPLDPHAFEHLEMIAKAGIKGVKFHPFYQDFSLADSGVWPVFEKIADLGLVAICHCGTDVSWRDFHGLCGPKETWRLLKNVAGLKFIAAHLGGCEGYPSHMTEAVMECGAYIDTATLHMRWHYDEQMRLLRSWPTERLLFGTDWPWEHYPEIINWIKSVRDAKDWGAIFGGNACRLLSI